MVEGTIGSRIVTHYLFWPQGNKLLYVSILPKSKNSSALCVPYSVDYKETLCVYFLYHILICNYCVDLGIS